jgi:predicted secreted protein
MSRLSRIALAFTLWLTFFITLSYRSFVELQHKIYGNEELAQMILNLTRLELLVMVFALVMSVLIFTGYEEDERR